jgi:hypothetical protein
VLAAPFAAQLLVKVPHVKVKVLQRWEKGCWEKGLQNVGD